MERQPRQTPDTPPASPAEDVAGEHDDLTVERTAFGDLPGQPPAASTFAFAPRLTPRARRLRLAATVGVVLLALAILLGSSPALRAGLGIPLIPVATATPTTPLLPGMDLFYFARDVPWASVTVDGHQLQSGFISESGAPLRLARGRHILTWEAQPFMPQRCVLWVPTRFDDTCRLDYHASGSASGGVPPLVIRLGESLATLPPDQANTLLAAMQQSVAGFTTTIPPGERYLGLTGIAAQSLHATLSFQLDVGPNGTNLPCWLDGVPSVHCMLDGHDCALLCAVPWVSRGQAASPATWLVFAPALPSWTYASLDGRVLARNVAIDPGAAGAADLLTLFSIAWDGTRWHVQPLFGADAPAVTDDAGQPIIGAACAPAQDDLQGYFFFLSQVRYVEDSNPANGCLAVATINRSVAPPPQVGPLPSGDTTATLLVRFSLLVALDDAAHRMEPLASLPTASERALAARLATRPGAICATSSGGC